MKDTTTSKDSIAYEIVLDTIAGVGEGAIWDYKNNRLLWIDCPKGYLHIYTPANKQNRTIKLGKEIGTVVPYTKDTVIVALHDGIYELDLISERLLFHCNPEPEKSTNRLNDGKCDAYGRLWVGSMDKTVKPYAAAFYKIDNDFSVTKMIDSVTISNGIAWSLDNTKMYYQDSPTKKVIAFDFDVESGKISNAKDIIAFENLGTPDGNTIDAEGMLWVANWDAACITRWNPETGAMLQKIELPALNITSLAFGGENLDELYVTSAQFYMPEGKDTLYPHAGKLFKIKTSVKGIKCNYFKKQ